jgi:hypothetical protein
MPTDPQRRPVPQPLNYARPPQRRRGISRGALDEIVAAIAAVIIVLIVTCLVWLLS